MVSCIINEVVLDVENIIVDTVVQGEQLVSRDMYWVLVPVPS